MIYLFDKLERLVETIGTDYLIAWEFKVKTNDWDQASFEIPVDYALAHLEEMVYFGFFHKGDFKLFKVIEHRLEEHRYVKGLDKAESDLRTITIIKDKRLRQVSALNALETALEGTGYRVGDVSGLSAVRNLSFYYISPREALVKIIEAFQCEFRVRYHFVSNQITSRYIDLAKRFGKPTGKQFSHGDNFLKVVYEESTDEIVTCLIGRGKGEQVSSAGDAEASAGGDNPKEAQSRDGYGRRIEFTDLVWSRAKGDPVDKPAGQNFIALDSAKDVYGLSQDGQLKHRWGVYVNEEIEDRQELLMATWEELKRLAVPIRVYKADILSVGVESFVGDTVAIIYDEVKIAFEARIDELVIDKLNLDQSVVTLGDYETLANRHSQSRKEAIQGLVDERMAHLTIPGLGMTLEAFYDDIEKRLATGKKEVDDRFRLANLEFDNLKALVSEEGRHFQERLRAEWQEIDQRIEKDLEAFRKELQGFSFDDETIDRVLSKVVDGRFDQVKEAIRAVSETSRVNAEMIGNDGTTRYNKNLLKGGTLREVALDGVSAQVEAQGGFKAGVTYTISFESLCELLQKVLVRFSQPRQKPWHIILIPSHQKLEIETTDDAVVEVYPDEYTVIISSDWYEPKTMQLSLRDAENVIETDLVYRSVADGNQDEPMLGVWAERPDIIFDGGGN